MNRFSLLIFGAFITACSANSAHTVENLNTGDTIGKKAIDTAYMHSGFYFLADKGVNMRLDKSDETYTISPTPFASTKNVSKVKLEKSHLQNGDYTELCMTFDKIGAEDLANGTGNPLHPKIAVIITNKLLYVVENTTSIKTGVMCVGLVGYTEKEMEEMRNAVDKKDE